MSILPEELQDLKPADPDQKVKGMRFFRALPGGEAANRDEIFVAGLVALALLYLVFVSTTFRSVKA